MFEVRRDGRFLGFGLVAVHHASLHGLNSEVNARLWNGFERLIVKINDALATFDNEFSRLRG